MPNENNVKFMMDHNGDLRWITKLKFVAGVVETSNGDRVVYLNEKGFYFCNGTEKRHKVAPADMCQHVRSFLDRTMQELNGEEQTEVADWVSKSKNVTERYKKMFERFIGNLTHKVVLNSNWRSETPMYLKHRGWNLLNEMQRKYQIGDTVRILDDFVPVNGNVKITEEQIERYVKDAEQTLAAKDQREKCIGCGSHVSREEAADICKCGSIYCGECLGIASQWGSGQCISMSVAPHEFVGTK